MQLPFRRGWNQWSVFRKKGERDLIFIESFDSYQKAERFIACQPVLTSEVAGVEDRVH